MATGTSTRVVIREGEDCGLRGNRLSDDIIVDRGTYAEKWTPVMFDGTTVPMLFRTAALRLLTREEEVADAKEQAGTKVRDEICGIISHSLMTQGWCPRCHDRLNKLMENHIRAESARDLLGRRTRPTATINGGGL